MPHPPIIVPEIGGSRLAECVSTVEAMRKMGARIASTNPDLLVIISPHSPLFRDTIAIHGQDPLEGGFGQFGAGSLTYESSNDLEFCRELIDLSGSGELPGVLIDSRMSRRFRVSSSLDHGVLVPLHYIHGAGYEGPLVAMGFAFAPLMQLYRFGQLIADVALTRGTRVALVASGDLSHKLTPDAPAGYSAEGARFDRWLMDMIEENRLSEILDIDTGFAEAAGECGLRSIVMLIGALDAYSTKPEVLSYEGPFGVGYGVADFHPGAPGSAKSSESSIGESQRAKMESIRGNEDEFVRLARKTVENWVRDRVRTEVPRQIPKGMDRPRGVFCTIKKFGELRGCIGTIEPTCRSIAEEITRNAVLSASEDPRFPPITEEELADLTYSVDVLEEPEPVKSMDELDPSRYGVIVSRGNRRGLLLPALEGVDTAEQQVAIARQKARISQSEDVDLERFEVVRHH